MLKKITKWETEDGKVFDTQDEAEDYMFEQEKEVMTHTSTEQPEALRLADALDDDETYVSLAMMRQAAAELRAQHASIAEMEAQLEAIGASGVEPLRKPTPAPQAAVPEVIEQMAVDRYKVVPSHESMFHRWAVVAGNGTQQLYIGREVECLNMARKFAGAFLDGAFVAMQNATPAHPAEGVPADFEAWWEKAGDGRSKMLAKRAWHAALATTQPAAQGMDTARLDYLQQTESTVDLLIGEPMRFRVGGLHSAVSPDLRTAIDAALAAQAKQGEQS